MEEIFSSVPFLQQYPTTTTTTTKDTFSLTLARFLIHLQGTAAVCHMKARAQNQKVHTRASGWFRIEETEEEKNCSRKTFSLCGILAFNFHLSVLQTRAACKEV
jgi:hypothetical protein